MNVSAEKCPGILFGAYVSGRRDVTLHACIPAAVGFPVWGLRLDRAHLRENEHGRACESLH